MRPRLRPTREDARRGLFKYKRPNSVGEDVIQRYYFQLSNLPNPDSLVVLLILWSWAEAVLRVYLNLRQAGAIDRTLTVPRELQLYLSEEAFERSKENSKKKLKLSNINTVINAMAYTVFYACPCTFRIWEYSKTLSADQKLRSLWFVYFVVGMNSLKNFLLIIPDLWVYGWSWYRIKKFIKEWLQNLTVDLIHYVPVAFLTTYDSGRWERDLCVTVAVLHTVYKMSLYYLYGQMMRQEDRTPLPEGELKERIVQLARSVRYPREDILYLDNCSDQEGRAGWATGVMALSNVLSVYYQEELGGGHAKTLDVQEILGLVAHELGHWKFGHRLKLAIAQESSILMRILTGYLTMNSFLSYSAFGFQQEHPPIVGAFISFVCISHPVKVVLDSVELNWSRGLEFGADANARVMGLGHALRSALAKMSSRSGMCPVFDNVYSLLTFPQPTPLERIRELHAPIIYRNLWRVNDE